MREKDRERERERKTERKRDRDRDRQTDRKKEREKKSYRDLEAEPRVVHDLSVTMSGLSHTPPLSLSLIVLEPLS